MRSHILSLLIPEVLRGNVDDGEDGTDLHLKAQSKTSINVKGVTIPARAYITGLQERYGQDYVSMKDGLVQDSVRRVGARQCKINVRRKQTYQEDDVEPSMIEIEF